MGFTNGQPTHNPVPKGKSRSQLKAEDDTADATAEEKWKRAVRKRDDNHCRWCKRRVKVTLDLVPDRAECHHAAGRFPLAIRWLVKNGLLLCNTCHERVTGRVNERFIVIYSKFYELDADAFPDLAGEQFPDAGGPVEFKCIT